jgi:small subunit ribosomal protein S24e
MDAMEDIEQLKTFFEACMLRVYEGIIMNRRRRRSGTVAPQQEESETWDDDEEKDLSLSSEEVKELDLLSRDLVEILNKYNAERTDALSRQNSRPVTPLNTFSSSLRPPSSSHATPYGSRSTTPTNMWRGARY